MKTISVAASAVLLCTTASAIVYAQDAPKTTCIGQRMASVTSAATPVQQKTEGEGGSAGLATQTTAAPCP